MEPPHVPTTPNRDAALPWYERLMQHLPALPRWWMPCLCGCGLLLVGFMGGMQVCLSREPRHNTTALEMAMLTARITGLEARVLALEAAKLPQ